jgi:prepilin-type N-terminal cleavage/methylation domain-containing protein
MALSGTSTRRLDTPAARLRRGLSLIELLIVIAIIGILASLLFPAIMVMQNSARRTACDNHARQIELAILSYLDVIRPHLLEPHNDEYPSGWTIAILPFTEEYALANLFNYKRPPTAPENLAVARDHRPALYVCPATLEFDSTLPGVGVCNYVLILDPDGARANQLRKADWYVKDAPEGSRFPWFTGPEIAHKDKDYPSPHPRATEIFGD